jgi:hypothetical protein
MGLLEKFKTQGTGLSKYGANTPPVNPGATKESKLHAYGNQPGYSLNGGFTPEVRDAYVAYNDGYNNALPQPSQLDLYNTSQITKYLDTSINE